MAWPAAPCRPAARLPLRAQPLRKQRPWRWLPSSQPLLSGAVLWSATTALLGSYRLSSLLVSRFLLLLYALVFGCLAPQIQGLLCCQDGAATRSTTRTCAACSLWAFAAALSPRSAVGGCVVAASLALLSRIYRGLMTIDFLKFQRLRPHDSAELKAIHLAGWTKTR